MRKDEHGNECPGALGEYRDTLAAINGEDNAAVELLDEKIALFGRDDVVIARDATMRALLMPLLVEPRRRTAAAPSSRS